MKKIIATLAVLAAASSASAAVYNGNGNTGFGGPVGNGVLTITDDGAGVITVSNSPAVSGNVLVLYIDSIAGGVADTSGLTDFVDGGRRATSGADTTTRSLVTFPSGFTADRAILIAGFSVGFDITNTNSNFAFFSTGGASTAVFNASELGLAGTPGQSFNFVGTLISETAFRSNEAYGVSNAGAANLGFNDPLTFSQSLTYNFVPEPATLGMLAAGALVALRRRK